MGIEPRAVLDQFIKSEKVGQKYESKSETAIDFGNVKLRTVHRPVSESGCPSVQAQLNRPTRYHIVLMRTNVIQL